MNLDERNNWAEYLTRELFNDMITLVNDEYELEEMINKSTAIFVRLRDKFDEYKRNPNINDPLMMIKAYNEPELKTLAAELGNTPPDLQPSNQLEGKTVNAWDIIADRIVEKCLIDEGVDWTSLNMPELETVITNAVYEDSYLTDTKLEPPEALGRLRTWANHENWVVRTTSEQPDGMVIHHIAHSDPKPQPKMTPKQDAELVSRKPQQLDTYINRTLNR